MDLLQATNVPTLASKVKAFYRQLLNRRHSKLGLITFVILFGAVGAYLLVASHADSPYATTSDEHAIVLQYSLPHHTMPLSTASLQTPMAMPPFTLYGNGLLVCSAFNDMKSMANMPAASMPATSTILSQSEVSSLIQQVVDTGFLQLNQEYYHQPVIEEQDLLQLNLLSGSHFVAYYNDVPAPAAYTATLQLLKNRCGSVTTLYQPATATLRVKEAPAPAGQMPVTAQSIQAQLQSILQQAFSKIPAAVSSDLNNPPAVSTTVTAPGEVDQTIAKDTASAMIAQFHGLAGGYINQNGTSYQVAVQQPLPQPSNPLQINYAAVRARAVQKPVSFLGRHLSVPFVGHAAAATPAVNVPMRMVVLVPSDAPATTAEQNLINGYVSRANTMGQQMHDWYCRQVGKCYSYQGATAITGSQTANYYLTCHQSDCSGLPLLSVLENVGSSDSGTIYRSDVDTELVTAFATNSMSTGNCGYGFIGSYLGVTDPFNSPGFNRNGTPFCTTVATSAHELGHTFGLNHTGNSTLMDGTPYTQYATYCDIANSNMPSCTLDGTQAKTLATSSTVFSLANPYVSVPPPTKSTVINKGTTLQVGQQITSPDGGMKLAMLASGNLVLYNHDNAVVWNTATRGASYHAAFQTDGNLVVYTAANKPVWDSKTFGKSVAAAALQNDGNLVMYTSSSTPAWSTGTFSALGSSLTAGQLLPVGMQLTSPDRGMKLQLRTDGRLMLFNRKNVAIWSSTTTYASYFALQTDSNLVIYDVNNAPVWASNTANKAGAALKLQNDGNLVLYTAGGAAVWTTGTSGKES